MDFSNKPTQMPFSGYVACCSCGEWMSSIIRDSPSMTNLDWLRHCRQAHSEWIIETVRESLVACPEALADLESGDLILLLGRDHRNATVLAFYYGSPFHLSLHPEMDVENVSELYSTFKKLFWERTHHE